LGSAAARFVVRGLPTHGKSLFLEPRAFFHRASSARRCIKVLRSRSAGGDPQGSHSLQQLAKLGVGREMDPEAVAESGSIAPPQLARRPGKRDA